MASQKNSSKPLLIFCNCEFRNLIEKEAERRNLSISSYLKNLIFPTIEKLKTEAVTD